MVSCIVSLGQSEVIEIKLCLLRILHLGQLEIIVMLRETICVHPLDFMIWPQVKGKCTNLATKATPTRIAIDGDRCSIDPSSPVCYSHFTATIMSSAVFASMRLNATNQSYLPVPITLATAYKMQHGDNLKLKTSHGLKIKIKIKEVASTLMPSRSKACVMILNRQGLIRCPVKTPSNSSSANKRSPDPSGQLTRASTFDHASSSKSVPFLRNGTVKRTCASHLSIDLSTGGAPLARPSL
uniref:Uncharacterized protein n=1 Tax=Oryza rufipogon TaxID=4529 RepID=A0A0E0QQT0_ORYRU